jgi:uncharacterized BrkB/YihY/UPF0761 family membrane protein
MISKEDVASQWSALRKRSARADDLGALYERDRDAFASVLGAAIALRLFLFGVGAHVVMAAMATIVARDGRFNEDLQDTLLVGETAQGVAAESGWTLVGILVSALVFTLVCGRALTLTLAASSAAAWGLGVRSAKVSLAASSLVTCVTFASFVLGVVMSMLRELGGWVPSSSAWVGIGVIVFGWWLLILRLLPRSTNDLAQLMPGAIVFAVGYTLLGAFMRVYVPNSIARRDDFLGGTATVVVLLGSFFFVGRLMSSSFVFTAVLSQRHGSLLRRGPR